MSSTSSISGGGESQWQLLKELRASQSAASKVGSSSAAADPAISIAPPTSSASAAPDSSGGTGGLGSVAGKLVADLQSFLLGMQSGADTASTPGAGSGSTAAASPSSQLSQQFTSSIQAYARQAGGLAGMSAVPSLSV